MPGVPLRVLLLSPIGTRINPYIGLLSDGLADVGAKVQRAGHLTELEPQWSEQYDVIHLHWLDHYDRPQAILFRSLHGHRDLLRRLLRRGLETVCNLAGVYQVRRWLRLRRVLAQLALYQDGGGRLVYTVHNLDPHEGSSPADRWATARLIKMADVVHVHDVSTAQELAARYGRHAGVAVIPHGHYLDSYPNVVDHRTARDWLGLPPTGFVFVTLGLLRPYKGLEELVAAFESLPDPDAVLLLVGKPPAADYVEALTRQAAGDPRVQIMPQFVLPEDVQRYLGAADICVLPYRQLTTSGAAMLAFSFGLPVIAPSIGAFPSLIRDDRGVLYDPTREDGLAHALIQAREIDWSGRRGEITRWVAQFDWGEIGKALISAYTGQG